VSETARHDSAAVRSFAIVPAAGRSRRMGYPKLLLTHAGRTLIEHVLAAWRASRVERVLVVVHPDDDDLAAICQLSGADVIRPETPPAEMKDSVACALAEIAARYQPTASDVWLLAPADMPALTAPVIDWVLAAHRANRPTIVVPTHGGRRGHPVLFPWSLATAVAALGDDEGINAIVARHEVREIETPTVEILSDIDSRDDFERWRNQQADGDQG
jgi:molybdenum cofactor cytidylyltransferase